MTSNLVFNSPRLQIFAVPQAQDNYAWVIHDVGRARAALVDGVESGSLLRLAQEKKFVFDTIFNTHHHGDHVGANHGLAEYLEDNGSSFQVFGGKYDHSRRRIPLQNQVVKDGDTISLGLFSIRVLEIPGHTLGHLGYLLEDHLFCGDTVFMAGCGRLFEGSPEQMYSSIHDKIASLAPQTRLYPAHEYSLANMRFALFLQSSLKNRDRVAELESRLSKTGLTLPTTIQEEWDFNPFFRVANPEYRDALDALTDQEKGDPVLAFARVRAFKDGFRG